jgi:cytochrome oxidase assembly protein ShyY1
MGLAFLAVALMAAMGALGLWQLGAYDQQQTDSARSRLHRSPVPLNAVLGADAAFPPSGVGQPVVVDGTYDVSDQFYVRHMPGAAATYSVVTPLKTADGSKILVVRGSSPRPDAAAPTGHVTVRGVLQPSEATSRTLDAHRVTDGIRVASLLNSVRGDLYAGYVILTDSRPAEQLPAVTPPLPDTSRWVGIRNLLYAIQWWVFGGFIGFMWWHIVRDEPAPDSTLKPVGYGRSP